ncbi:tetratricopeptide repeat protein [Chlorobium ferrooxidans]|uniref:Tetratricopeptide TPR_3 n=1 Tax=Chlorobium ferrooxidans DSM 13031 TaxID=377431 RepID=Q0YPQ0_9CHLB|nr:tetratricopeptide repeat protein [Chlorobium ferrooxidans]EAT58299.1 Tetratricopeptide TPR_3 [Chlorobium ferrooxidans DSM 13031]
MIRLSVLFLFVTLTSSIPEMFSEYRLKLKADALYNAHDYSRAENAYRQLLRTGSEPKGAASSRYNLACALYMQGKYREAASLFAHKAAYTPQQQATARKSLFNEGNALAMSAINTREKTEKTELFRRSLARFKSVLLGDPDDGDAKINYEIVQRYLQELESPPPQPSSGSGNPANAHPDSGIGSDVASRILEKAQQDESSLMRQIPRSSKAPAEESRNNRDW